MSDGRTTQSGAATGRAFLPDVHGVIRADDAANIIFSLCGRTTYREDGDKTPRVLHDRADANVIRHSPDPFPRLSVLREAESWPLGVFLTTAVGTKHATGCGRLPALRTPPLTWRQRRGRQRRWPPNSRASWHSASAATSAVGPRSARRRVSTSPDASSLSIQPCIEGTPSYSQRKTVSFLWRGPCGCFKFERGQMRTLSA